MKTFFIGKIVAKPGQAENLIQSLELLKDQPGFIDCQVYRSTSNPDEIISMETWENQEDHENFVKNLPEGALDQWMSMQAEKPTGDFYQLAA